MTVLDRALGRTLDRVASSRILAALASPHGADRYLEMVDPMLAATEVRARVVDVHRETEGEHPVATLTLQPTSTWRGHRAGQYVQVGVETPADPGRRHTRCFSISSAESGPGERFTLTIRAQEDGRISRFLVTEAEPGLIVHLSQAAGDFTLHESPATPTNNRLLFITGGSGITPAMAMVRTLLRDGYDGRANRKVVFVHYARSEADQIFAEELARIAAEDNHVDVHLHYGEDRFSAIQLARIVPQFRDTDTWVCGPPGLTELVRTAYDGSPRLRQEHFHAPTAPSDTAEGQITFAGSGVTAENDGRSLLEQAESAGLSPEFGCRRGICLSCTSTKTQGTVRDVLTGQESALPDEDVRLCVSAPVGDCTVDI